MKNGSKSLSGLTFNVVGVLIDNAWVKSCAMVNGARYTKSCQRPGFSVEALVALSRTLGFEYRMIWVETYDQLEEMIVNGTADFSLTFLAINPKRYEKFVFLPALNVLEYGFMAAVPKPTVIQATMVEPFDLPTWLSFLGVFLLVLALIHIVSKIPAHHVIDTFFNLLAFGLNQNDRYLSWTHYPVRIKGMLALFLGFWFILQTLYSGMLIAFLQPVQRGHPFRDTGALADLVASGKRVLFDKNTLGLYYARVLNSQASAHVLMQNALRGHPLEVFKRNEEAVPGLRANRNRVLPLTSVSFFYMTRSVTPTCSMLFVKDESLVDMWESIVVRKGFPHLRQFQKILREGVRETIFQIGMRNYYYGYCTSATCPDSISHKPLRLGPLMPLIMFWAGGYGMAIGTFLFEVYHARVRSSMIEIDRRYNGVT